MDIIFAFISSFGSLIVEVRLSAGHSHIAGTFASNENKMTLPSV